MSYYRTHVFFCLNAVDDKPCCQRFNARDMHRYAKSKIKSLSLHRAGEIRINKSGCLGRCDEGPTLVIYPDNVWYTYIDREDIDEIINEHLLNGRIVTRLLLDQVLK
jgi:(2Fe-2S) ferredoxin